MEPSGIGSSIIGAALRLLTFFSDGNYQRKSLIACTFKPDDLNFCGITVLIPVAATMLFSPASVKKLFCATNDIEVIMAILKINAS